MSELVQMNLSVSPDLVEKVEALADDTGWSKRRVVEMAVTNYAYLLETLPKALEDFDDDIVELFVRVIREWPSRFVELTDAIQFARIRGEIPAIRMQTGWVVYPAEDGEIEAIEEETGRHAKLVDGELKVLKLPTPDEVVLN